MTHRFRNRVLSQLAAGSYAPEIDDGVRSCVASLPWWRVDTRGQRYNYDDDYDRRRRYRRHRRHRRYRRSTLGGGPAPAAVAPQGAAGGGA